MRDRFRMCAFPSLATMARSFACANGRRRRVHVTRTISFIVKKGHSNVAFSPRIPVVFMTNSTWGMKTIGSSGFAVLPPLVVVVDSTGFSANRNPKQQTNQIIEQFSRHSNGGARKPRHSVRGLAALRHILYIRKCFPIIATNANRFPGPFSCMR